MQKAYAPHAAGPRDGEHAVGARRPPTMGSLEASGDIQKTARTAGFLYMLLIPLGIVGMLTIPNTLFVEGDTAQTMANIASHETLFRASILTALITQVVQVFVVWFLYRVLRPAGRDAAALMVIFILLGVPIAMLNELHHVAVLTMLHGDVALVELFLNLHHAGIVIAQVFWGLWLLPMGYLVVRSGFLPKIIGLLLVVAGAGYLADSILFFMVPGFGITFSEFTFLGELLITFWLLLKGVDVDAWRHTAGLVADGPTEGPNLRARGALDA